MPQALISLGSNLGDSRATLERAAADLTFDGARLTARSSWYETLPVGGPPGQEPFLNGVLRLETTLEPDALLERLLAIEADAGRERTVPWGPRTLDLDLLFYDDRIVETPRLRLPHPRAAFRKFVLEGAAAVAPEWRHPILGRTLDDLYRHLCETPRYVALVGATAGFRSQLAAEGAHVAAARLVEPTDSSLPATVDDVVCDGPDSGGPIEFVRGRAAALERSIAAGDDWFVDDAWLAAEAVALYGRLPIDRRGALVEAWDEIVRRLPPPRLVACVVTAGPGAGDAAEGGSAEGGSAEGGSDRHAAAVAVRTSAPWPQSLPPVVDLVVADREGALGELAAALDAAS